jgi:HEAT repeat protein
VKINAAVETPGESRGVDADQQAGSVQDDRAVKPLINALQDQHEQVREAPAKSLGIIGDRRALDPLNQALQGGEEQVRKKAVEALGLLKQSGGDFSMSMNALRSPNPMERALAACALGRLGAVDAIPALINLLGDDARIQPVKCWDDGDWSPARHTFKQASPGELAAIALASFSQSAVEPLIAALNDGNPSVRSNAAWALGEIGELPAQAPNYQLSKVMKTKTAGRLSGDNKTLELKLMAPQWSKKARLKINGQLESGNCVWTLRDPKGKSAFRAESDKTEFSIDSGDLDVIPGTWTLQVQLKNGTLDFEVNWNNR